MMTKPRSVMILISVLLVTAIGCFGFGRDEETTTPTESQMNRCRTEMYLNDSVEIMPLGFKLLGWGIDDAIWFKFETNVDDLSQVFDTTVVDTSKFKEGFTFMDKMEKMKWWDVQGKRLLGGEVSLPNGRFMNVGAEKVDEGYVIYIMWHET
jgi:hypothetical protein